MDQTLAASNAVLIPPTADSGAPYICIGYPDECNSFADFARYLTVLAGGERWYCPPTCPPPPSAILLDFLSDTEAEADTSVGTSWCAPDGLHLGTFTTTSTEEDINEQNERKSRHRTMIATALDQNTFQFMVLSRVLDARSCPELNCTKCQGRLPRSVADVIHALVQGTGVSSVHLFSKWDPSATLRHLAERDEIELVHFPLSVIPGNLLDKHRHYTTWYGTPLQAAEFRKVRWAHNP